jgi:raffinose/stachyose/melibiose transport system permease protein
MSVEEGGIPMRRKVSGLKIFAMIFALIWLFVTLYPLVFMLMNSVKEPMEFFMGSPWKLPEKPNFDNYINVWNMNFPHYLKNTVIVVIVSLTILVLAGSMAAYAISRLNFKFKNFFFLLFIAGITIPIHITLIPVYTLTRQMGLYDSIWGLIGPYVGFNLPITIFILKNFMDDIPISLEEAAKIDGATRWQMFWKIVFPLSAPAITAVTVYDMVILWNEFIFSLVLINSPENRTLTLGLWDFQGQFTADIPAMLAALFLSTLPLLVFYAITGERLIKGMTAGAVKG